MQDLAKKYGMVLVVPIYEQEMTGLYYNTAAVIDHKGQYLGRYRKHHIPHCPPRLLGKSSTSPPATRATPSSTPPSAKSASISATTATSPKAPRELGLNGAEIVFNPSAPVAGLSEYLWKLEQPAHAVANQYFIGAINRVGTEKPWNSRRVPTASPTSAPPRPNHRPGQPRQR